MNLIYRTVFAAAVAAIVLSQSGCLIIAAGAAAGAGVAYYKGDLETTIDSTPDKIAEASRSALQDLNINIISASASGLDGDIVGRTASDDKVHITIKSQSERTSKVAIRIGYFGDQAMSARILSKINEKLANPAPSQDPPVASGEK